MNTLRLNDGMIEIGDLVLAGVSFCMRLFYIFHGEKILRDCITLTGDELEEAVEASTAKDCKLAVMSLFPVLFITVVGEAIARGLHSVDIILIFIAFSLTTAGTWCLSKGSVNLFRGRLIPPLVMVGSLAFDLFSQTYLKRPLALLLV